MTRMEAKTKIVQAELSYKLTGICFRVHNQLGRFGRERQYCDEFERLLKEERIRYKREVLLKTFDASSPDGNKADFLIEESIIIDFKAKSYITKSDYVQMQRYLKAANLELG